MWASRSFLKGGLADKQAKEVNIDIADMAVGAIADRTVATHAQMEEHKQCMMA